MRPAGRREKKNNRRRVRNRRYKIKRFTLQPRNINVTHNGTVVRRMVVRRRTIHPSARRRREYWNVYFKNKKSFTVYCLSPLCPVLEDEGGERDNQWNYLIVNIIIQWNKEV